MFLGTLVGMLLVIAAGVGLFISAVESIAWQSRQSEATAWASETIEAYLKNTQDTLLVAGLIVTDKTDTDSSTLASLLAYEPALLEIVILDKDGRVLAEAHRQEPLLSNSFTIPQSNWFNIALQDEIYIGSLEIAHDQGPYIIKAVPTQQGHIVAARLSAQMLWRVVGDIKFGQNGSVYIIDRNGAVVAHTDPLVPQSYTTLEGRPELELILAANTGQWYGRYMNFEGVRVVGVAQPVTGSDWIVITELPAEEAYAITRRTMVFFGMGTVLVGILVWLVSKRFWDQMIFKPLMVLQAGVESIGQGDPAHQIDVKRQDEIGQLAEAFNEMASRLNERKSQLSAEIAERQRISEQLAYDALHDDLTDLPNRSLLLERLRHVVSMHSRNADYLFAVLFMDLDDFKLVNDSLGHDAGDTLLVEVASRLTGCVREIDTVARWGGDEFVVLLEDIDDERLVTRITERIHESIAEPYTIDGHQVNTKTSTGIVFSAAEHGQAEDYLRDADIAMYRAKASRDPYVIFDRSMRKDILDHLALERDLQNAMQNNEFGIRYQPIIALQTGELIGLEALLCWRHPGGKLLYARDFVKTAEELGLIVSLDHWVLRQACRQVVEWQKRYAPAPSLNLSVNISARQFALPDQARQIKKTLSETGLPTQKLWLEFTESAISGNGSNGNRLMENIRQLKTLGVSFLMDDFGTGHASWSYMQIFPIDLIKIDHTIIAGLDSEASNLNLVRGMLLLAHELGIQSCAEGIETVQQLERLQALGCEYGQGYFLAKPRESAEMEKLFAADGFNFPRKSARSGELA